MPRQLTWSDAIQRVLASSDTPLHYTEITERIIAEGLRHSLGATPAATVGAQISASIKHEGAASPYVRVGRGTYALRPQGGIAPTATPSESESGDISSELEEEAQYSVITSFGMFWRRELVDWVRTPKLLGQQPGASTVDFSQQYGIYLLYDGREVIYVGRVTERGLGLRLYEHTIDRLAARWDRFSWFGLRPVSDDGSLGPLPARFEGSGIIPALEAILVEALEPRQNRRRGDDLATVEFIQQEDPELQRRRLTTGIVEALNRT